MLFEELYTSGAYLEKWPAWHVERSPWIARQVFRMMMCNNLAPTTVCEVGCGAGEVLKQLQVRMSNECQFLGYEISPQAFEICQSRANEHLHFKLADFTQEQGDSFDLILILDVIEHVEDYFTFLRAIKPKSSYKILHIPLDLAVNTVLRGKVNIVRKDHGHIHYFTKDLALQALRDVGYEVLDHFYTAPSMDLPVDEIKGEVRRKLMKAPRKLLSTFDKDLAALVLGGYSLMVLAQ